jgi:hypothetical protein
MDIGQSCPARWKCGQSWELVVEEVCEFTEYCVQML